MTAPITHYSNDNGDLFCLSAACRPMSAEPSTSDASDYHDEDCNGNTLECAECGEYVFPAAAAEQDAEYRHMEAEFRSGRLGRSIGRDRDSHLAHLQAADPAAFYINCKDNPDKIDAACDYLMRSGAEAARGHFD